MQHSSSISRRSDDRVPPRLRLLLLRHGQVPQVSPRRFLGQRDVPLDETGERQAAAMGRALGTVRIDRAWCSDLRRAVRTAGLVLDGRDLSAEPTSLLREIRIGAWEGLSAEELQSRSPGAYEERGRNIADYRTEGGESFRDVQRRGLRFLDLLASGEAAPEREPAEGPPVVLAVAHAGLNRGVLCAALEKPLEELFDVGQDYCALNVLDLVEGRWVVRAANVAANAVPDLSSGLLPPL